MKICILAAGRGSRVSIASDFVKGLLPVDHKPIICHLIENCPSDWPIVMAVGYHSEIYQEFFSVAYPNREITFVEVDPFEGPGSGPGLSLLACEEALKSPFFLLPTDAFLSENLAPSENDWIGLGTVQEGSAYCLVELEGERVCGFRDKDRDAPARLFSQAFTGIAYIKNYDVFFSGLRDRTSLVQGEKQVAGGFKALLREGLNVKYLPSWKDLGTDDLYWKVASHASDGEYLIKPDEYTYQIGHDVVKYHCSTAVIKNKVKRAKELSGMSPEVKRFTSHFFSYAYVEGHMLSEETNIEKFSYFLEDARSKLFQPVSLSDGQRDIFRKRCFKFYHDKTVDRLNLFFEKFGVEDNEHQINGLLCPPISDLLEKIDWKDLSEGIPTVFHGDFQPENIIVGSDRMVYIDWRHEFMDNSGTGDLYYDLAKMKHALILCGEIVRGRHYSLSKSGDKLISLHFYQRSNLVDFLGIFDHFLASEGYSETKVDILTGLIYLNIAPLYQKHYAEFLYYLGKHYLTRSVG